MCNAILPRLYGQLRGVGGKQEQWEDAIGQTFVTMWQRRREHDFPEAAAWYSYVAQTARNKLIDILRTERGSSEPTEDTADPRYEGLDNILQRALQVREILQAADDFWLGERPQDYRYRLLSAQLYCFHGMSLAKVRIFLQRARCSPIPATDEALVASWANERLVRELAYQGLYRTPQLVTAALLDCVESELVPLFQRAPHQPPSEHAKAGWTWEEVGVIQWKFFDYRPTANTLDKLPTKVSPERIQSIVDRCVERLPFSKTMEDLCRRLSGNPAARPALEGLGLWRRLAVQYIYADGLPHRDFEDWMSPPAKIAGFKFMPKTVHGWISTSYLAKKLLDFLKERNRSAILE